MKTLLVTFILFSISLGLLTDGAFRPFSREEYINQKILDTAAPINVKINLEFLRAYTSMP